MECDSRRSSKYLVQILINKLAESLTIHPPKFQSHRLQLKDRSEVYKIHIYGEQRSKQGTGSYTRRE